MVDPLLSVVIPCFNGARFLDNCVAHLSRDSTNPEIVLIDDGSNDDSLSRAKQLMLSTNARMVVLAQKNQGQAAARNLGIRAASGKYLCFLDVDDTFVPGSLVSAIELLEREASLVAVQGGIELVNLHRPVQKWQLESMESTMLGNVVVRADVARELGGFPTDSAFRGRAAGEDGCFRVQLPRFGRVAVLNQPLLRYQVHRGSHIDFFLDRASLKPDGTLAFSEQSPEEANGSIARAFNAYSDRVSSHLIEKVITAIQKELGGGFEFHRLQHEQAGSSIEDVDLFEAFALYTFCRRWPLAGIVVTLTSRRARSTRWITAACKAAGGNRLTIVDNGADVGESTLLPEFATVDRNANQGTAEPVRVVCALDSLSDTDRDLDSWMARVPVQGLMIIAKPLQQQLASKLWNWKQMLTIQRLAVLMKVSA